MFLYKVFPLPAHYLIVLLVIVGCTCKRYSPDSDKSKMAMVGGIGEIKEADADIQAMVDGLRDAVAAKTNANIGKLTAISYGSQVVAGTNYFVKVKTESGQYLHLRIFKPLPYTNSPPELSAVQQNKTAEDPIVYFD